MQVTLDAIDWTKLTSFPSSGDFFEWLDELEDVDGFAEISCYDQGWDSDSAIQYFEVAGVLEHLAENCDEGTALHLREGIQKLISEEGHVDEFGVSEESEGLYWISASPEEVKGIKSHIDALDLRACADLLLKNPPPDADDILADLDGMFISYIKQHSRMVDAAVSHGYGLLGHCG